MVTTDLAAVQAAAVFMARVLAQAEAGFTARAIHVTKVVIISNPAREVSSSSSLDIRAIQSS